MNKGVKIALFTYICLVIKLWGILKLSNEIE